ncbi:hypothetical protein [Bacillus safensis]|uniref:hypothetical protein n=1 Tax=Bacillus safensis TaxID=561879 RepID=UPI002E23F5CA|nr:hypothetical protein [Bacillus safensis]
MEHTVPTGTIVEASNPHTRSPDAERYTIDGNENTFWFTNTNYGTLTLIFPHPVFIDGLKFAARSWKKEDYFTIEVLTRGADGSWRKINSPVDLYVESFFSGPHRTETVWITPGQYSTLRIDHRQASNHNTTMLFHEVYIVTV